MKGTKLTQQIKNQIYFTFFNMDYTYKEVANFYDVSTFTICNVLKELNCPGKRSVEFSDNQLVKSAKDLREEIYLAYANSDYKYPASFCKAYDTKFNVNVLKAIVNEYGGVQKYKANKDEEETEVTTEVVEEPVMTKTEDNSKCELVSKKVIKRVNTDNHLYCTFFKDRHDTFPDHVKKAIYGKALDSFTMFNMDYLYKKSVEFIQTNITSDMDIVVYMSGLQVVTGAIVKACLDEHVNLTFMHYNKDSDEWYRQTVIDCFDSHSLLSKLADSLISIPDNSKFKYDDLYTIGDVDLSDAFYIIKIQYCDDNDNVYSTQGYICDDGWEEFSTFSQQMLNTSIRTRVSLLQGFREDANRYGFRYRGPLAISYNSPKLNKED